MRIDDHRFYTSLCDTTLLEAALLELPIALATQLPESTMLNISYGWGCQIHAALQHIRMEVLVSNLGGFVGESLRQGIVVPGDSDLHIEVPKGRLWLTFDHEGYVFSHGSEYELETSVWMSPAFSRLPLDPSCRGAGLIDYKRKIQQDAASGSPLI